MKFSEFLFFVADRINSFFYKIFCRKRAEKNYKANICRDLSLTGVLENGFIVAQTPLKNFRFGIKNIAYGGCGVIALYNILNSRGQKTEFCRLIKELEKNALLSGIFGLSPHAAVEYLKNKGFQVRTVCGKKRVLKEKPCANDLFLLYFRKDLSAHYVSAHSFGNGKYKILNSHISHSTEVRFEDYLYSLMKKEKILHLYLVEAE